MKGLKDKVALVTGGGGRIGAAAAARLAGEGARVVVADLNFESAQAVAQSIGAAAFPVQFDAELPESIEKMVAAAAARFGRLDILLNNAALLDPAVMNADTTAVGIDSRTWDRTMAVNVRGYMLVCKYAIPHMRKVGGGSIINTSSNAAISGDVLRIAYGSSKGAIVSMTKYIATQHGRENIRCNAILPGFIVDKELETRMPQLVAVTKRHLLVGRNGVPDDIASLVAFLASEDSAFITGQAISCDGGLLAHVPFFAEMLEGADYTL